MMFLSMEISTYIYKEAFYQSVSPGNSVKWRIEASMKDFNDSSTDYKTEMLHEHV